MPARIAAGFALALALAPGWPALAANAESPRFGLLAPASAPSPLGHVRTNDWAGARAASDRWLDPAARRYVRYDRMTAPGAATVGEIDVFLRDHPDWPGAATLALRRQQALAVAPDEAVVLGFCARLHLDLAAALLRCAGAFAQAGRQHAALADARLAWLDGVVGADAERLFMQAWGEAVSPEDQWRRFLHVAGDPAAALRQLARLDAAHRQAAQALLALRRGDARAPVMVRALPDGVADRPALVLARAAWLRGAGRLDDAARLWTRAGAAAERAADAAELPAFWPERDRLARDLLAAGDAARAYRIAAGPGRIVPRQALDADFLAGWIALRRLHDPVRAARHFAALGAASRAVITQARAQYWLARCAAAGGDAAAERAGFTAAAAFPTTYYGQLAALALGDDPATLDARIAALHDPRWTRSEALGFLARGDARMAALLVAWGERWRARPFLARLAQVAPGPTGPAMAAHLALGLGLPEMAVAIARRASVSGLVLADAGWPQTVSPPPGPVEPAVILGLIRQESSFDADAASPAGARGLMQLMPTTARLVARELGQSVRLVSLTADPAENVRLGDAYLAGLIDRFGGSLPLAFSAYNAGPGSVARWLAENGDPLAAGAAIDMIDWIEMIPYGETRDYVQRVVENVAVYRARMHVLQPYPVPPWRD